MVVGEKGRRGKNCVCFHRIRSTRLCSAVTCHDRVFFAESDGKRRVFLLQLFESQHTFPSLLLPCYTFSYAFILSFSILLSFLLLSSLAYTTKTNTVHRYVSFRATCTYGAVRRQCHNCPCAHNADLFHILVIGLP